MQELSIYKILGTPTPKANVTTYVAINCHPLKEIMM